MARLLKLDPRPPSFDSMAEASLDVEIEARVVDDVESTEWLPVSPPPMGATPIGFIDGVQRLERRVSAEGEGLPAPGIMASYAAGAVCPGEAPALRHVRLRRELIVGRGINPDAVTLVARNTEVRYTSRPCKAEEFEGLLLALNERRAELEADVMHELIAEGPGIIVVDGRLPLTRDPRVVGLIKTLQHLYVTKPEQIDCLVRLGPGQRSPVFLIERPRPVYSWFVCLATPPAYGLALSGLTRLEIDEQTPRREVLRMADMTAAMLPRFASAPHRDERAPQNLMPIAQLERELRHRLGDVDYIQRLVVGAFMREKPGWNP